MGQINDNVYIFLNLYFQVTSIPQSIVFFIIHTMVGLSFALSLFPRPVQDDKDLYIVGGTGSNWSNQTTTCYYTLETPNQDGFLLKSGTGIFLFQEVPLLKEFIFWNFWDKMLTIAGSQHPKHMYVYG